MKGNDYWTRNTINKILQNETYIGSVISHTTRKLSYKIKKCERVPREEWIIVPDMHEPIIDKEMFYEVQELRKKRTSTRNRKHDHILKGLLKCGECGGTMTVKADYRTKDNVKINFICSTKNSNKMFCDNSSISGTFLTKTVLENIKKECEKIVLNKDEMKKIFKTVENEINTEKNSIQNNIKMTNKSIEKLDIQIKAIYEDKLNKIISVEDFLQIYQAKKEEKEKLQNNLNKLEQDLKRQESKEVISRGDLKKFADEFLKMENPSKETISKLVDRITIYKGRKIKIKYKFSKI